MYSDYRKLNPRRPRPSSVRPDRETKLVRNVYTRKLPYRVGYNWNRGGRLKELRIRHLARKFLKIWIQNTFGRILPHKANSHNNSVVLKQAFEGWRDEWWTSRREWSLTMRAECHYRYYLYNLVFRRWRTFMSLQRERKSKLQIAQSFADRQQMGLVWDRWEVFTEMRRMKNKMLASALEQNRLGTLRSAWSLWQTQQQQCYDLYALEEQGQKHCALTLQRRAWLRWKEMHVAACCQNEKECKASRFFIFKLKRKMFHQWMGYVLSCEANKNSKGLAQRTRYLHLMRMCWSRWRNALQHRWREEEQLQASAHLAKQSIQRRALDRWKDYVRLCREETVRNQIASQHYHHSLLTTGLQGLSINIIWNKTHRLNNNMAVQHYHQTMLSKYWKMWQDRLEEAEDKSFQPLAKMAQKNYSTSLLSSCLSYWRGKLAEQRHMQDSEHQADIWFADRMLPHCFNSWVAFTLQKRRRTQRRHKAEVYNRQRQYIWVFYTWWGKSETHKAQMLSERRAIVHEKRCHVQRAWSHWRQRTEQQIHEKEKEKASDHLYLHRLLHKAVTHWRDNSTEIRERRNREQQACHQGDLSCMKWAVEKWKKFVQSQRVKKSKLKQIQHYHEVKLLKHAFDAWKSHHLRMAHIYAKAEELYRRQTQHFLRAVLSVWRKNSVLLADIRLTEQRVQNHFKKFLQLKVFLAWRKAARHAISRHHQHEEAVIRARKSINQAQLLWSFRQWRMQTREAQRERICMEKARLHHNSKILSKALKAWNKHHYQYRKYKLQHRQREAKQTSHALWHWSLTLQAKVLYGWRLWVTDQRRKQEQAARAAHVYRDKRLKEDVTHILTYAAHMNDLTSTLVQHSQEQRSRHLQRVVKCCGMQWKKRALCKPLEEQKDLGKSAKKSVTFCLTTPGLEGIASSVSVEQEAEDGGLLKLIPSCMPRRQPRRREDLFGTPHTVLSHKNTQKTSDITSEAASKPRQFSPLSKKNHPAVISCLRSATSAYQSPITSLVSFSDPHISTVDSFQLNESPTQIQDPLPLSAFMTTGAKVIAGSSNHGDTQLGGFFKHHTSSYEEVHLSAFSGETEIYVEDAAVDPAPTLVKELMNIQTDIKSLQQDRKQLCAWQRLKEILESWLQTSGKEGQMEKNELKELEESIDRLSTKMTKQKPTMLLHAERIQHLQTVFHALGVPHLLRQTDEMKTELSLLMTLQEKELPHTQSQSDDYLDFYSSATINKTDFTI